MLTHDVTVPGARLPPDESIDEPPHVVGSELVDLAAADPVEDVIA